MRLTKKKIDEVVIRILGENGLPLVELLKGKDNISEFNLAKKLNLDIKVVRKMLYLLYNHNLVSFTRKKDKQKGWYIYYWTIINDSIKFAYFKRKKELLTRLEESLERESSQIFFVCPENCVRLDFDAAMDFEFHCPECGKLLDQEDNAKRVVDLKQRIESISDEIEEFKATRRVKRKAKKVEKKKKEVKKKARAKTVKKKTTKKKVVKKKVVKKKSTKKKSAKPKTKVAKKKAKVAKKKAVKKKAVKKKARAVKAKTTKKKTARKKVAKKKSKK